MRTQLLLLVSGMLACVLPDARGDGGCVPPPAGLVGWWRGEGNANDWAGNANGTNQGGIFYANAQVGQGFTFDSDDDWVVIPHRDAFNPGASGFTVQFWMKGNKNQPGLCGLVEKSHGYVSPGTGWAFQADPGGSPAGQVSFAQFGASAPILSSVDVLDDQWHHVSGTWDGASTARLYVDGILRGTAALTTPANNTRLVNLGFCWGGGAAQRFFRGQLDEVAIHNRALSSNEIATVHAAGSAGMCANGLPSPWLHQDINSATPPGDAVSTDGKTFTLHGGGWWSGTNPGESFHFVYRPITGDGILTACLSELNGGFAGVMMRETLTGSGHFAMTTVQPGAGIYGFWRSQPGAASAYSKGSAFTLPTWIKVVRQANLFSHYMSSNGINWSLIASNTLPMTNAIFAGLVACEYSSGSSLATATFSNVTVNADEGPPFMMVQPANQSRLERETALFTSVALGSKPLFYQWFKGDVALADDVRLQGATSDALQIAGLELADSDSYRVRVTNELGTTWSGEATLTVLTNPLPSPWVDREIGPLGQPGAANYSNGVFSIQSPGTSWGASSEQFHFVYQSLPREGGMLVRLVSVQRGGQAALMIRENLGNDACRAVWILSDTTGRQRVASRPEPGQLVYSWASPIGVQLPYPWLKLLRSGDWFSAFVSTNAIHWTFAATVRVSMPDQVHVGMAATGGTEHAGAFDQPEVWSGLEPAAESSLRREVWFGVAGSAVSNLTDSAAFAGPPSLTDSLRAFESEGLGTNYGQRVSGYLLAPETGPYVFHLASDNAAQLWLSPDANPANRVLIVEAPVAGARRDWSKWVSAPVTLQAGGLYYLEALHKQDTGSGYLGVAWTLPYRLASANGSEPIPGNLFYQQLPEGPPRIVQSPSSRSAVAGGNVSFAVQAEGPPLSYQWRKDDQDLHDNARLSGTRTPMLTFTKVQPGDAGRYTVVVRNLAGSVESLPAELSVNLPYGEQPILPLQLRIEPASSSGAWLCWPGVWAGVSVEASDGLSDPGSWVAWEVSPQQSQGEWWVWLSPTNQQQFFRLRASSVPPPPVGVPPEPASIAPALPASVVTTLGRATEFLYTGPDAVQLGVTNGTIQAEQAAVVRGRVITRDGAALAGVDVRIAGHSEFGFTRSRADGRFDLAVNGGGLLTVNFEQPGYLPAQRQVNVPWQDYTQLEDVALVPQDSVVTRIDLASTGTAQVARGSVVADQDGARTATLLFPAGTHATMTLPDGSTQPLTTLHVRATEYTVGSNGPKAMPAELPPTIGYTYCVELGVDEADAVGAKGISFDQPIPFYVENFLGFPVGGHAPVGYYDRERAEWIPSPNGRVIRILGQTAGLADLDITGSNVVADATSLAALGVNDAERARLAGLYPTGQTLWRVPIPHLSTWDVNWGWGPPLDAVFPLIPPWLYEDPQPEKECPAQSQRCQRAVPIAGTPYTLSYSSDRTPAFANTLEVPYSHTNVPPSTKRIDLVIEVNGRKFTNSFTAAPNGRFSFLWDQKDAYGRPVQGCQRVTVRVGFVYDGGYQSPADLARTFGQHWFAPEQISVRSRADFTLWQELTSFVGGWHSHGLGFGGWSLNNHHAYDPNSRTLYYGDGRKRAIFTGSTGDRTVNVSAGGGTNPNYDIPATEARLYSPQGVAVAANGELYIADTGHHRIIKLNRNGLVRHVAGTTGKGAFAGDGGQAVNALLNTPTHLALAPDGSLYFIDSGNARVRRIAPSGIISTVAGGGTPGDGLGDGGPATSASLVSPADLAVGRDGRLFIADTGHNRVRVISPDGNIETAVGGGDSLTDGSAAAQWKLVSPTGVAVAPDGTLYVVDDARGDYGVVRVDLLGRVFLYAGCFRPGSPWPQPAWNGRPALKVDWVGAPIAVGLEGDLYFRASWWGQVIARVRPDGLLQHVAGGLGMCGAAMSCYHGDGGPAVGAGLLAPVQMAFGPDGKLYFPNYVPGANSLAVIRQVALPMPGVTGDSFRIPSEDGAEVYVFDESGRHLETVDALTGAALDTFQYNPAGLLTSVTDGDGNVTAIERAANGAPMAIVGPFGQRTALQTDANGNLSQIKDPAGNTYQLTSRADGLLESLTDPRTNRFNFDYDAEGRLLHEETAGCCAGDFTRVAADGATTVTAISPEGRQTVYASETLPSGEVRQVNTFPDSTANETLTGINASRTTTFADGTVLTEQDGGDIRFGMEAPLLKSQTIRTPSGLTRSLTTDQQVLVGNPSDPLSLIGLTNIAVLNGRTNVSRYDAATRTFTSTTPEGRLTFTTVDAQARPIQSQVPGLEAVHLTYDARGRLAQTSQGDRQSALTYDPVTGFLAATTNALGQVTAYQRDAVGRVTALTLPDGSSWIHDWDANDNLAMLTEPNGTNHHQFTYTSQNLMETYRSPLGATESFTYNKDQELIRRQFPSGQAIQWNYATNGQLASIQTPEGNHTFTYYATNGLLASATSRDGQQVDFAYDGSLLTNAVWSGVVTGIVRYVFDNDLRVTWMAYAGLTLTNGFDGDGLLTNVGTIHLPRNPTNGLLSGITDGAFTIAYQRNEFGEITNTVATQGAELYRVDRSYDALGRITRKTETIAGTTVTWDYAYDTVGQLVQVKRDGVVIEAYAFDAVGNRIGMTNALTGETLTAGDYRYDADNKLLQAGIRTSTYDADGRLQTARLSGVVTTFHYNTDGTLAGVDLPGGKQITYLHDSQGRRIARTVNGVRTHAWLYGEGLMPLAEYDGNGALRTTFIYGGRWTPVAFIRNGATNHLVTDHLGSPRLVVDPSGAVIKRVDYDAFGNVTLDTDPTIDLLFGFAGGMSDPDHELIRFGARDIMPSVGRWTGRDPMVFIAASEGRQYASNEPVNQTDRLGLEEGADAASDAMEFSNAVVSWANWALMRAMQEEAIRQVRNSTPYGKTAKGTLRTVCDGVCKIMFVKPGGDLSQCGAGPQKFWGGPIPLRNFSPEMPVPYGSENLPIEIPGSKGAPKPPKPGSGQQRMHTPGATFIGPYSGMISGKGRDVDFGLPPLSSYQD